MAKVYVLSELTAFWRVTQYRTEIVGVYATHDKAEEELARREVKEMNLLKQPDPSGPPHVARDWEIKEFEVVE